MSETRQRGIFGRLMHSLFVIVTSYFAILGLIVTLCGVLIAVAIYKGVTEGEKKEKVAVDYDQALLQITVDRRIIEESVTKKQELLAQFFSDELPYSLKDLQDSLRRAADDSRILGVVLDIEYGGGSMSTITSLRESLLEFEKSKKPVFVHMSEGDTPLYYLGSVANKINLAPVSGLSIPGPTFQLTYFASALEKLGIEMEVVRAGKYKSAMEPFVRDAPSPETLEMYTSMSNSLRHTLIEAIAAGRKKDKLIVEGWLKHSLFTTQQAVNQGLVDRIGYFSDWIEELKAETKAKDVIDVDDYMEKSQGVDERHSAPVKIGGNGDAIAVIEARGEIVMATTNASSDLISPKDINEELKWARETENVKAVVLRVNSPGGSALASDLIWDEVRKLAKVKPVVVSMGAVAASGGYYISAPATLIMAEPTTITGSIGVIGAIPKGLKFAEKWGVSFHVVSESDRKNLLNFGSASTDQDKRIIGESIDETYGAFINKVAEGRKQDPTRVREIAEGRVYTGEEALKLQLVDKLGGFKDALQEAKQLAKLDPTKLYPLEYYESRSKSVMDRIWNLVPPGQKGKASAMLESLGVIPVQPLQSLHRLQLLMEDSPVLAYWPGTVNWGQFSTSVRD